MASQAILLRRFLWHVTATETGVGLFYACWLFWVAAGAAAARARRCAGLVAVLASRRRAALLVYLPLIGLQYLLLGGLRAILGVPPYAGFPLGALAAGCLLANAPVSVATGLLLPAMVRGREKKGETAPSVVRAFAWEGLGAAAGGAAVTLIVAFSPLPARFAGVADWRRFFGEGRPERVFSTPRGRYLCGRTGGACYVLGCGGVTDHWPDRGRPREIAAVALAQRPRPRNILLHGEAPLSLALAMRELADATAVWWCHVDPAYAARVLALAAATEPAAGGGGLRVVPATAQAWSAAGERRPAPPADGFDLLVAWPPGGAGAEGAAWWEKRRLAQIDSLLADDGVVVLPLGAGATEWSELAVAAAAVRLRQIGMVWRECRPVPGAGGWAVAARRAGILAETAREAARRFAAVDGGDVPAALIGELYDDGQTAAWLARMRAARAPRTRAPRIRLRALGAAAAWQESFPALGMTRLWPLFDGWRGGVGVPGLLLALASLPLLLVRREGARSRATALWLACGGALALAGSMTIMERLQVRFGTLYLLAGMGSGCYLCGMACGNLLVSRVAVAWRRRRAWAALPFWTPFLAVAVHVALLGALALVLERLAGPLQGVAVLAVAGLPAGAYLPVATHRDETRDPAARLAARVMEADSRGGAVGGLLWVLLLQPFLGTAGALLSLAAVAMCAALPGVLPANAVRRGACGLAVTGVLAVLLAWGGEYAGRSPGTAAAGATGETRRPSSAAGSLRRQIDAGRLADHEADFWEPAGADD